MEKEKTFNLNYKSDCIKKYTKELEKAGIQGYEKEIVLTAFETGFNVGIANFESEDLQKIALASLHSNK